MTARGLFAGRRKPGRKPVSSEVHLSRSWSDAWRSRRRRLAEPEWTKPSATRGPCAPTMRAIVWTQRGQCGEGIAAQGRSPQAQGFPHKQCPREAISVQSTGDSRHMGRHCGCVPGQRPSLRPQPLTLQPGCLHALQSTLRPQSSKAPANNASGRAALACHNSLAYRGLCEREKLRGKQRNVNVLPSKREKEGLQRFRTRGEAMAVLRQ